MVEISIAYRPFAGPVPTMTTFAPLRPTEVILAGTALTFMVNGWVALGAMPFAAVIVPVNVPACEGNPEISPALLIVSPVGNPEAVNVIGDVPLAVHVKL